MREGVVQPDPIEYMDLVAATAAGSSYKALVLSQLDLHAGHLVLDVGCGPGTDLTAMQSAVADGGLVLGVDAAHRMARTARARTVDCPGIFVTGGDAHSLPINDDVVDRIRTDRAPQHMAQPGRVLSEFRRVLRSRGVAVVAEPDWGTLVVDCSIAETSRIFVDYVVREVVRNPLIGRQAARLGHEAGFATGKVSVVPTVLQDFETADKVLGLGRTAMRAFRDGYLTSGQVDDWLRALRTQPMLASLSLFVTTLVGNAR